jgi:hypothetical protein
MVILSHEHFTPALDQASFCTGRKREYEEGDLSRSGYAQVKNGGGGTSTKHQNLDTPPHVGLTPALRRNTQRMARSNAGIKRNRQTGNDRVTRREVRLTPNTEAAYSAAAEASGNLSLSLYLERLRQALEAEGLALPVLSPTLEGAEVLTKAAA